MQDKKSSDSFQVSEDDLESVRLNNDRKSSVKRSIYNIICTMVGAGILGLPTAVASVGWVYGLFFITLITILACYSGCIMGIILRRSALNGNPIMTYEDMGYVAVGTAGKWAVYVCSYGTLFFVSILMLVLSSDMWSSIFPNQFDTKIWILISAAILFPLTWIRTLNHVAFISFFGMIAVLVVVAYVFISSFADYAHKSTPIHYLVTTTNLNDLSSCFTTIVFSFGGAPLFSEIYRCLKKPESYPAAMKYSFSLMYILYLLVVVSGYLVYGDYLLDPSVKGNIVVALPASWGKTMVSVLILIHVLAAFLVVANPLFRCVEGAINIDRHGSKSAILYMILSRAIFLGIFYFIAILIPFFLQLMSLIGATTSNAATFILPCWFYAALFWREKLYLF